MIYQPIPLEIKRADCEERYKAIRKHMNPHNKTLLELCCANGYFGFRFLQDEGANVVGIEIDNDYVVLVNTLANIEKVNFKCQAILTHIGNGQEKKDYGIYLDTHFSKGTNIYLVYLSRAVKVSFISSAYDNDKLLKELQKRYKDIKAIYTGFKERIIYKCC